MFAKEGRLLLDCGVNINSLGYMKFKNVCIGYCMLIWIIDTLETANTFLVFNNLVLNACAKFKCNLFMLVSNIFYEYLYHFQQKF